MAIFVEGQTEQAFAQALVYQVAGMHRVHVDSVRAHGGRAFPRHFLEVHATRPDPRKEYYVVIYDSSNDSRVLSDIREHYENLVAQRFSAIIGIRDVYPQRPEAIPAIRAHFAGLAPAGIVTPILALAIMEIEAWFIAEYTHFQNIHPTLTSAAIHAVLGYDPATYDVQTILHPADDLRRAYAFASIGYDKSRRHVERTISALDYAALYLAIPARIPDLNRLTSIIDRFLS